MRNHYSFEMNEYRAFTIDLMIVLSNNEISSELLKIDTTPQPQTEPVKPLQQMKPLNKRQQKTINKIFLSAILVLSLARVIVILIDKL